METPSSFMYDLKCFRSSDAKKMWRDAIKARDEYSCVYCGSTEELTIDHVRPKAKGGSTTANNCVTCCKKCNQAKGSLELAEFLAF